MSSGIKCSYCGHLNPLGRIFCAKCGKRLDLKKVNKRVLARSAETPSDRLRRRIKVLTVLVLAGVVGMILWPAQIECARGIAKDAASLQVKIRRLERAVAATAYVYDVITEHEVNAFLQKVLEDNPGIAKSEGMQLGIEKLCVRFTPDEMKVFLLANWGALRLSYEVVGVPEIRDRRFRLVLRYGRFGHLPLPGPVAGWMGERIARALSEFKNERRLLDALERCDLGDGRLRVVTRAKK